MVLLRFRTTAPVPLLAGALIIPIRIRSELERIAGEKEGTIQRLLLSFDHSDWALIIVMMGEIRDEESAEALMRLSSSGHRAISTLHTNSACEVPNRLFLFRAQPFACEQRRLELTHDQRETVDDRIRANVLIDAEWLEASIWESLRGL
jgi:type IV secretory pathway ATPase VirB11/archaellum biosynthesis ATPase